MHSIEDHARQWEKRGTEDLDTLSACVNSIRLLIQIRIKKKLNGSMSTPSTSILKDPTVTKHLFHLHDKYVVVPTDKVLNTIVCVCKSYLHRLLHKEIRYWQFTWKPYIYPDDTNKRGKYWIIIGLFCVPLDYQSKMKNWIYLHYTGFLNYTRALTNSVILLGLPNAHMGANCVPLLTDLFLYSYNADFIQGFLKKNEKKITRSFNFTFRYIDDVLSLNNS